MSRPTRDETCMDVAKVMARRSTCSRLSVGVVFATPEGRVLSSGYNGAPAGMSHCDHTCNCETFALRHWHDKKCVANPDRGCDVAVHAEANGIAFAAKNGIALGGCWLYTTLSPCLPCAKLIINAGIVRVYMDELYRELAGMDLLKEAGIELWDGEGHAYI